MKRMFAIATLMLSAAMHTGVSAQQSEDADQPAKVLAEQVCVVCHGAGGHSTSADTPNLAAQPRQYLAAKIRRFRNASAGKPDSHIDILGLTLMDDPMVDALARYYAAQPPPAPVAGNAGAIAIGGKIYARGAPEQNLAPCGVCHGANGAGLWIFPRLAGQHAEYVVHEIRSIQERSRHAPLMHGIIKTMTPEEINAVAMFVQSQ